MDLDGWTGIGYIDFLHRDGIRIDSKDKTLAVLKSSYL